MDVGTETSDLNGKAELCRTVRLIPVNGDSFPVIKPDLVMVACGSFNPITIGHLRIVESAADFLRKQYATVVVVLSPVHDAYIKPDLAPAQDRISMLRLALAQLGLRSGSSYTALCDGWEATKQHGWTRTASVLEHMSSKWFGSSVKLLIGYDVFETMNDEVVWTRDDILAILDRFGIVVYCGRGNDSADATLDRFKTKYGSERVDRAVTIVRDFVDMGIRATFVRQALQQGRSQRYIVDDKVLDYIEAHRLYRK